MENDFFKPVIYEQLTQVKRQPGVPPRAMRGIAPKVRIGAVAAISGFLTLPIVPVNAASAINVIQAASSTIDVSVKTRRKVSPRQTHREVVTHSRIRIQPATVLTFRAVAQTRRATPRRRSDE